MTDIFLSIAPIFLLIVLGQLLWRKGIPSVEFWDLNNKLVYWILFPSLLFYKTSTIELAGSLIGSYAIVILGGFACAIAFSLFTASLCKLDPKVTSSVMQGSARHNSFVALAMAERLFGNQGLSIAALIVAILIPVTNIIVVSLMVTIIHGKNQENVGRAILHDLVRNPILVSVLIGISVNLIRVGEIPIIHDISQILGGAALPVVLLCIGANIRLDIGPRTARQVFGVGRIGVATPMALSIVGKMMVFPTVILILVRIFRLPELDTLVAILIGAMPTASSSYTLAKQMGGDSELMAAIITTQTGLAFISVPISIMLVQTLF